VADTAGSLLLRSGLVTEAQLAEADLLQRREGGTLGESLIRMGAIDEEQIVDFFHRRLLVPRIEPERFTHVQKAALVAVPADMAAEFGVFPLEIDADGTLTLAMADPSDAGAADEVGFFTERFCQRAVAHPSLVRAAIQHYYGVIGGGHKASRHAPLPLAVPLGAFPEEMEAADVTFERDEQTPLPPARPLSSLLEDMPASRVKLAAEDSESYDQIIVESQYPSRPDDTPPMDPYAAPASAPASRQAQETRTPGRSVARLDRTREAGPGATTSAPMADTVPEGEGAGTARRSAPPPIPADGTQKAVRPPPTPPPAPEYPDPPLAALRAVGSREDIARTLLNYMVQMSPRAALFVVRKKMLVGYDGKGMPLDLRALRQLRFPAQAPSLFRDVMQSRLPYRGPTENTPVFDVLTGFLSELPGDILLFPISVREKVVAVLYADGLTKPVPDAILLAVVREAGRAYERLILESKH
jgi:hypothetical protein